MAARRFSFLTLGGALAVGVGLWTYVSLTRAYEDDLIVPLTVVSSPNQALLSTVPPTLTVRVRATGLQLLNFRYFSQAAVCTLDLRRLRPISESQYLYMFSSACSIKSLSQSNLSSIDANGT